MRLLILFLLAWVSSAGQGVRHELNSTTNPTGQVYMDGRIGDPNYYPLNNGDTLALNSNQRWVYLSLHNFRPRADSPIVVINTGGGVALFEAGIELKGCWNMKVTGEGSLAQGVYCGFKVHPLGDPGQGQALSVQERSKSIEFSNIEVYRSTYGFAFKHDPIYPLVDSFLFPNWHMDNIYIHHCRFKNIGQDVGYAGNTDPTGQGRVYGPLNQHATPMRLSNIRIEHCWVDSANRTGFQLSGADSGVNVIAYDTIQHCGNEYNTQQGVGIYIGGMAYADVHHNIVNSNFNPGIQATGIGLVTIHDCFIDSNGRLPVNPFFDMDSLITAIDAGNFAAGRGHVILTYSGHTLFNTYFVPPSIYVDNRDPTNADGISTNNQGPFLDSVTYQVYNNTTGITFNNADIYFYQNNTWRTYRWNGNVICNNYRKDAVTPSHISYRGAADGQDPNPDPGNPATGFVFRYSTNCEDIGAPPVEPPPAASRKIFKLKIKIRRQ